MSHVIRETVLPIQLGLSARNIAIVSIALSGAVHLFMVREQFSHVPVHGIYFVLIGTAQLLGGLLSAITLLGSCIGWEYHYLAG